MKRKPFYILLIFLLVAGYSNAQVHNFKEKDTKWTIGAILINEWNYLNYIGGRKVSQNYFDGITVKRHFENLTARLGLEYITINNAPGKRNDLGSNVKGYLNEGIIRFGVESVFANKRKLRPYYALDIALIRSYSDLSYKQNGSFFSPDKRETTKCNGIGLMPALGLEYNFNKQISLSLETRLRIIHYSWRTDIYNSNYEYKSSYTGEMKKIFFTTYNRIGGLTLNVRF